MADGVSSRPAVTGGPVVLFDGVCTFCNGAVQFILDHEKRGDLRFAPLQSEPGIALLEAAAGPAEARALRTGRETGRDTPTEREAADGEGAPSTMVLLEDGRVFTHSTAALRIAHHLRAPWSWAVVFFLVPRFVRDAAYRAFAANRYRWFGREETCRVPTPELRARFLA